MISSKTEANKKSKKKKCGLVKSAPHRIFIMKNFAVFALVRDL